MSVLDKHKLREHLLTLVVGEHVADHEHAVMVDADLDSAPAESITRRDRVRKAVAEAVDASLIDVERSGDRDAMLGVKIGEFRKETEGASVRARRCMSCTPLGRSNGGIAQMNGLSSSGACVSAVPR